MLLIWFMFDLFKRIVLVYICLAKMTSFAELRFNI